MHQISVFAFITISTARQLQQPCDYSCESNGGCSVKYVGLHRSGLTSGICFGGKCSGTPPECKNCNQVVNCDDKGRGTPLGRNSTEGMVLSCKVSTNIKIR